MVSLLLDVTPSLKNSSISSFEFFNFYIRTIWATEDLFFFFFFFFFFFATSFFFWVFSLYLYNCSNTFYLLLYCRNLGCVCVCGGFYLGNLLLCKQELWLVYIQHFPPLGITRCFITHTVVGSEVELLFSHPYMNTQHLSQHWKHLNIVNPVGQT